MPNLFHKAAVAVAAVALLASTALAAPPATQYQSTLTSPPVLPNGSTIKITKSSKIIAKIAVGAVNFQLKMNGVTDITDMPANVTFNTAQIDVVKPNGATVTVMFTFDVVNGKVNVKVPVSIGAFPGGPLIATDTIDIRRVRLLQGGGNGNDFAVAGLTIK